MRIFALACLALALAAVEPLPFLHPLFSDRAVLQRDHPIGVHGWSTPGDQISVALGGAAAQAIARADGSWNATLQALPAGGPHRLEVRGGTRLAIAHDVLIGEVWFGSGQSNMLWNLGATQEQHLAPAAELPGIRLLQVPLRKAGTPQAWTSLRWQPCDRDAVLRFSAIGYHVARELHRELDVPVGIVVAAWGGTRARQWLSPAALGRLPWSADLLAEHAAGTTAWNEVEGLRASQVAEWWRTVDAGTASQPPWNEPAHEAGWAAAAGPHDPSHGQIAWFRRRIELSAATGADWFIDLGPWLGERVDAWLDGVEVEVSGAPHSGRIIRLPADQCTAGPHLLTVRVQHKDIPKPARRSVAPPRLRPAGEPPGGGVELADGWLARSGAAGPIAARPEDPAKQDKRLGAPGLIHHGMIAPLRGLTVRGLLWYQGESDAAHAGQYAEILPAVLADLREVLGDPQLPAVVFQLPAFGARPAKPVEHPWAVIRDIQRRTVATDPHAALVAGLDQGDAADIHPPRKQVFAQRAAAAALALAYGRNDQPWSGPLPSSCHRDGATLVVRFGHAAGLTLAGESDRAFALAGTDGRFVWATAAVEGDALRLTAPGIDAPQRVRYGWGGDVPSPLRNAAGLTAPTFELECAP